MRSSAHLAHGHVIRDQNLTPDDQIAFSRRSAPWPSMVSWPISCWRVIRKFSLVSNRTEDGKYVGLPDAGRFWHTDQSYEEKPASPCFTPSRSRRTEVAIPGSAI